MNFYDAWDQTAEPAAGQVIPISGGQDTPYGLAALRDECELVASTPVGQRDDTLNRAWFRMGRHIGAGNLTAQTAREQLAAAARLTGQPEHDIQRALRTGSTGGLAAGAQHPRQPATPLAPPEPPLTFNGHAPQRDIGANNIPANVTPAQHPAASGVEPDSGDSAAQILERLVEHEAQRLRVRNLAHEKLAAEKSGELVLPHLSRLDTFLATPDDPLTYRINGLWPAGGRVVLSAPHKAGKTTTVGNTLRALADHTPFLGRFDVTPAARILLIDNELDERMLRRWLRDQTIINTASIELIPLRGKLSSFNILDPAIRSKWAQNLQSADVLVFDCLRPALDALGLSEDKDAGRFLEALDELTREAAISDTLLIHHMGHNGERSRGDSRILDWPDAVWKLVKDVPDDEDDDDSGIRRVYFTAYGRDVDQPETQLDFNAETRHLTAAGGTRSDSKSDHVLARILEYLEENPRATYNAIVKGAGIKRTNARKAINTGIDRGLITVERAGQSKLHTRTGSLVPTREPVVREPVGDTGSSGTSLEYPEPVAPQTAEHPPSTIVREPLNLPDGQSSCNSCGQPTDDAELDRYDGYCRGCAARVGGR